MGIIGDSHSVRQRVGTLRRNIFQWIRKLGCREGTDPSGSHSKSVASLGTEPELLGSQAIAPTLVAFPLVSLGAQGHLGTGSLLSQH